MTENEKRVIFFTTTVCSEQQKILQFSFENFQSLCPAIKSIYIEYRPKSSHLTTV